MKWQDHPSITQYNEFNVKHNGLKVSRAECLLVKLCTQIYKLTMRH